MCHALRRRGSHLCRSVSTSLQCSIHSHHPCFLLSMLCDCLFSVDCCCSSIFPPSNSRVISLSIIRWLLLLLLCLLSPSCMTFSIVAQLPLLVLLCWLSHSAVHIGCCKQMESDGRSDVASGMQRVSLGSTPHSGRARWDVLLPVKGHTSRVCV